MYTALARMAATAGQPNEALQAAHDSLAAGHVARLRQFVPALKGYCAAGNVGMAFKVRDALRRECIRLQHYRRRWGGCREHSAHMCFLLTISHLHSSLVGSCHTMLPADSHLITGIQMVGTDLAMQVDALIAEHDLDLTEEEYAQLMAVCAHDGATWQHAAGVLARMSRELTQLQPGTLAAVERFFRHATAHRTPPLLPPPHCCHVGSGIVA